MQDVIMISLIAKVTFDPLQQSFSAFNTGRVRQATFSQAVIGHPDFSCQRPSVKGHCGEHSFPGPIVLQNFRFPDLSLVHGQVTIIFVVSVCLSVCLFVQFFSAVFDPILIKLGHMLYVWV